MRRSLIEGGKLGSKEAKISRVKSISFKKPNQRIYKKIERNEQDIRTWA